MAFQQTDITGHPVTDDRKGSLTLRADHMNYSRAILNSHWHQARESEPKDYDLNRAPVRTMTESTYKRIGNITDGSLPETTYQDHSSQVHLKPMFEDKATHQVMVQQGTLASANAGIDRDTGDPKKCYGSVLPYHNKDHGKFYLDTTYNSNYIPPYPMQEGLEEQQQTCADELADKAAAYRKMKSQFTDTVNHRRNGWNTWQDESGVYANSHFKSQVFPKTKTTLPPDAMAN